MRDGAREGDDGGVGGRVLDAAEVLTVQDDETVLKYVVEKRKKKECAE